MDNKTDKTKVIFMGTPEFAVPGLEALIENDNFEIISVICGQDKKVGRKQILCEPAVKVTAKKHNLKILQPAKIIDSYDEIKSFKPDLIVVIAYGQIIPKSILELPKYACINVHGSLLPKYRGASCVQAAILNMDKETGITIMKMDEKMDTGPIIYQEMLDIDSFDTCDSLSLKLSALSKKTLAKTLIGYMSGTIREQKQDDSKAVYVKLTKKEDGRIDLTQSAEKLNAFVRAMTSWPGAFFTQGEQMIKIIEVGAMEKINLYQPGQLFKSVSKLFIQCGQDALEIKKIQLPGKKVLSAQEFLQGYSHLLGGEVK